MIKYDKRPLAYKEFVMSKLSTKEFVEQLYSASRKNTSLEDFSKSLGLTVKQVEAKRNNINGKFSKAGKDVRLPALKSKPNLSIDELANYCEELAAPKPKKPRADKTAPKPKKSS